MSGIRLARILTALGAIVFASGCALTSQQKIGQPYSAGITDVLAGKAILGHELTEAELPHHDLFKVTPEMEAFAKRAIRNSHSYFEKVKSLQVALLSNSGDGRGIIYSAYVTEAPRETFEQRRANCLSFTLLYVAMARAVGIGALINQVEIPPTWDLRNKKDMIFLRHVNVKVSMARDSPNVLRNDDVIIDLEMSRYRSNYTQRTISDVDATAQFYSNRAMEYLEVNNLADAFLSLRKSIQLNDQLSYVWSNLGALYSRKNLWREAELVYLHALELNPEDLTVINNLAYLYRQTGQKELSQKYARVAQRYRESNPFYKYNLALLAFAEGNFTSALQYVTQAIDREESDARFYELAADLYERQGKAPKAAAMRKKAEKLKPDEIYLNP